MTEKICNETAMCPIIVGGGNLGGAVARGLKRAGYAPVVVELPGANFDGLVADGFSVVHTLGEACRVSDGPVFIALKPWLMAGYCTENSALLANRLCVSCAAMVNLEMLKASAPQARWGRIMTNIAAAVGAGFTGIARDTWTDSDTETVKTLCSSFSDAVLVTEKDLDGIIGLSGSAIAYVFELLEGFIQGGLAAGMKGDLSLRAGIATLIGAAELTRESGSHPAVLKDKVCTPGGTTIAGLRVLNEKGFKNAFVEAVAMAAEKGIAGAAAFQKAK